MPLLCSIRTAQKRGTFSHAENLCRATETYRCQTTRLIHDALWISPTHWLPHSKKVLSTTWIGVLIFSRLLTTIGSILLLFLVAWIDLRADLVRLEALLTHLQCGWPKVGDRRRHGGCIPRVDLQLKSFAWRACFDAHAHGMCKDRNLWKPNSQHFYTCSSLCPNRRGTLLARGK
jgi:hypothetical protein